MSFSFGEIIAYGFLGLVAIYLAARVISHAFFKSKQQYEAQRKNHG